MSHTESPEQNATHAAPKADRLLRLAQVKDIVALGKTMIYRLIGEKSFPQPLKPGGNAARWSEAEIFHWLAEQVAARPVIA
jgi:prophage regulatory protein